mgnify:CR=1 FL=1
MNRFYTHSTIAYDYLASGFPMFEAYLQRYIFGNALSLNDMPGCASLGQYLKNSTRDGGYRCQQSGNLSVFRTELPFFDFWKQD